MSKKILVLGAGGLLGSALCPYLESRGHQVIKQGRRIQSQYNVDITEADEASKFFSSIQPEVIINLAALTNVDYCETHPQEAYRVNSHIVENISDWLKSAHSPCHLIQISTDQLYDGSGLHQESKIDPANYYSFSKYIGELAALKVDGTVLRVNFFGLSGSDNRISFTDWLFQALQKKDPISVFEDVFFSPLCIESLVEMIELVVILKPIGTYNVGSTSGMSKAQFAFHFANELGFSTKLMRPISIDQIDALHAYRPKNMMMNVDKFQATVGIRLPLLIDQIIKSAKDYYDLKK